VRESHKQPPVMPVGLLDLPDEVFGRIWTMVSVNWWSGHHLSDARTDLKELLGHLNLNKRLSRIILATRCATVSFDGTFQPKDPRPGPFDHKTAAAFTRWLLHSFFRPARYIRTLVVNMILDATSHSSIAGLLNEVLQASPDLVAVAAAIRTLDCDAQPFFVLDHLVDLPVDTLDIGGRPSNAHIKDERWMRYATSFNRQSLDLRDATVPYITSDQLSSLQSLEELRLFNVNLPLSDYANLFQSLPKLIAFEVTCTTQSPEACAEILRHVPPSLHTLFVEAPDGFAAAWFLKVRDFKNLIGFTLWAPQHEDAATYDRLIASLPNSLRCLGLWTTPMMFEAHSHVLVQR
jgi:hypothetical protein